jgi:hypothetical protein
MNKKEITNSVKENFNGLLKKKKLLFIIGNVVVITMAIVATYFICKEDSIPEGKAKDPSITIKTQIQNLHFDYIKELNTTYNEYKKELEAIGKEDFEFAKSNVDDAIKQISNYKSCALLIVSMAKDKIKKTNKTEEKIKDLLKNRIISPCNTGSLKVQVLTQKFMFKLQEIDNKFRANCQAELKKSPKTYKDTITAKNFEKNLTKFDSQVKNYLAATTFTAVGTTIEALLIRQTLLSLAKLSSSIATKVSTSSVLSVIDGPLPIGDIFSVVGLGWCIYDAYKIVKVLPEKMKNSLNESIDNCSKEIKNNALNEATKAFNFCIQSAMQTTLLEK